MRPVLGGLLQPLEARRLELRDLLPHEPQPRHVAAQLGERVRRQRRAFRRAQRRQALRGLAQGRLEAADAQAGQGALHPVHDPGALADEPLPLAARALGVLLLEGRDRGHAAVVRLAAQPAQEGALEQLGVEPVGLGPPVLARDGDARRVDDVGLDAARPQPAGEPEAVAPGLEGDREAGDRAPGPGRLVPPAPQQREQRLLVRRELLQRVAPDPGHDARRRASSTGSARPRRRACCPAGRRTRDRLRSSRCGMGHSIGCSRRRWSLTRAGRPIASEPGRAGVGVPARPLAQPPGARRRPRGRGGRGLRGLERAPRRAGPPPLAHQLSLAPASGQHFVSPVSGAGRRGRRRPRPAAP